MRLLKDICIQYEDTARQIVLVSHQVTLPSELEAFSARFRMSLPTAAERQEIVKRVADEWSRENPGARVKVDPKAHDLLIQNLAGLTYGDTERLARNAVYLDGAITRSDLPDVMQAKYKLLNRGGALQFEYDTARFNEVGGLSRLKKWLSQRKALFRGDERASHLEPPKGILLIGIQGCGNGQTVAPCRATERRLDVMRIRGCLTHARRIARTFAC